MWIRNILFSFHKKKMLGNTLLFQNHIYSLSLLHPSTDELSWEDEHCVIINKSLRNSLN